MSSPLTIYTMNGSASGMGAPDYSNLVARVSRLEDVAPSVVRGGGFAGQGRNKFSPLDSTGVVNGKLSLTSSAGISFQGIMAPNVVDGQFTVACPSDSSATIYWDGTNSSRVILIRRADGTVTTVPGNNLTVTGLTASATYQAFSFWVPFNSCGIGWSPGDTGTPLIAFSSSATTTTLQQAQWNQSLAGREPLGSFSWTQPSSGNTSSASDPSAPPVRQPGTCVRLGTSIEVLGSHGKSEVEEVIHPNDKWIHLETDRGLVLECTPDHRLYHAEHGKMEAQLLKEGDLVITKFGEQILVKVFPFIHGCNKVEVKMKAGHLFWANSFLSHNIKLPSS